MTGHITQQHQNRPEVINQSCAGETFNALSNASFGDHFQLQSMNEKDPNRVEINHLKFTFKTILRHSSLLPICFLLRGI